MPTTKVFMENSKRAPGCPGYHEMRWKRCAAIALLLLLGLAVPFSAVGYVLQGPHVLQLMADAMAGADTLMVTQEVMVSDPLIADQGQVLKETLRYLFSNRFRSETDYNGSHRFYVVSAEQTLSVVDGYRDDVPPSRFERYKDLLLHRNRQKLHKMLLSSGVDVEKTSLGRFEDEIVYVIGAQFPDVTASQIWVDKERFLPLRWISISSSDPNDRTEFVYRNWRKWDKAWYPMKIEIFHNQRLVRQINVKTVAANAKFDTALFDVARLRAKYPQQKKEPTVEPTPSHADDVQQTIEEFQKKFEQ